MMITQMMYVVHSVFRMPLYMHHLILFYNDYMKKQSRSHHTYFRVKEMGLETGSDLPKIPLVDYREVDSVF